MADVDKALQTQLSNIEERTGKKLAQLFELLQKAGLDKHGAMVAHLKNELGMGHGDANTVVHMYRKQGDESSSASPGADPLDAIYTGKKAELRPLHDAVMKKVDKFGDFEIAPKKGYVSLRRKKQFAMVGPGTKGRLEIGVNLKDGDGDDRFVAQKPGGMCQFKVWITEAKEVDKDLVAFLKRAFVAAG